jgi:methyltransferase
MSLEVWFTILVLAVGVERLAELVVSKRNAAWSFERGGVETGREHFPFMVVLHTGFLVGALVEVWVRRPDPPGWLVAAMLVLAVASQVLRWWCITTLGPRWNTRVIVVPGLAPVTGGPYRWLSHPNYVAVVVEGLALPLVGGAWITALVFTVVNAGLLRVRLRVENEALASLPAAR